MGRVLDEALAALGENLEDGRVSFTRAFYGPGVLAAEPVVLAAARITPQEHELLASGAADFRYRVVRY